MRKMFGRLIGEKIGEYISNVRGAFDRLSTNEFSIRISLRKKCINKETVGNLSDETLATRRCNCISLDRDIVDPPVTGKI